MRRTLALCAAAAALRAAPAAADPMDLDLGRLGAPAASVWIAMDAQCRTAGLPACQGAPIGAGLASQLAHESTQRYRLLALQLGLGLTSSALDDATTGGFAGFDVSLEGGATAIRHPMDSAASTATSPFGPSLSVWPVHGEDPSRLWVGALRVRKSLPFSFMVGGKMIYVNQSRMAAAQAELKWAIQESYVPAWLPDLALRGAYTRLFGQRDLELNVIDADVILSKRFPVAGTVRLAPYAVARFSWVGAKTPPIDFGPTVTCPGGTCPFPDQRTAAEVLATTVPFPDMKFRDNLVFRWAVGGKLNYGALALAAEFTYQPGKTFQPSGNLAGVLLPDAMGGSFRAGFDF
jgi:hypothetical protein